MPHLKAVIPYETETIGRAGNCQVTSKAPMDFELRASVTQHDIPSERPPLCWVLVAVI